MGTQFVVSFPGIGIESISINKIAFTLPIFGGLEVRWYGIILTLGIIAGLSYALFRCKTEGISKDDILDYAIWTVMLAIIGARLYYVLTTLKDANGDWNYDGFLDVIAIWNGGIAMYGSIIGGALALLLVSKVKKFNKTQVLKVFDMVAPGVMLGQIIGRWGNFCNGEAHGIETAENFFLRMGLKGYADTPYLTKFTYYHPTFLYESLWNLLGFVLINIFYKKKKFDGQVTLMYLAWYGLGRMFIEGLRTDSLYIGVFRISQVVGFLCFVICGGLLAWLLVRAYRAEKDDGVAYVSVYDKLRGKGVLSPDEEIEETDSEKKTEREEETDNGKAD